MNLTSTDVVACQECGVILKKDKANIVIEERYGHDEAPKKEIEIYYCERHKKNYEKEIRDFRTVYDDWDKEHRYRKEFWVDEEGNPFGYRRIAKG